MEEAFCGHSVPHLLVVEKYWEERVALPVDQPETPVLEILPGPVFRDQNVGTVIKGLTHPSGFPLNCLMCFAGHNRRAVMALLNPLQTFDPSGQVTSIYEVATLRTTALSVPVSGRYFSGMKLRMSVFMCFVSQSLAPFATR